MATWLTPCNGLPWPPYLPYPLTVTSRSYLSTELIIFIFGTFSSIFFCTNPIHASTFYVWRYLSAFYSSFKTLLSQWFKTTGLVITLDIRNPKFYLGKTPAEIIGFSGRLVQVGRAGFGLNETVNSSLKLSSCSEACSCDSVILRVSFHEFLSYSQQKNLLASKSNDNTLAMSQSPIRPCRKCCCLHCF